MIERLLRAFQKAGALRGLRGDSRAWTAVWVLAIVARQVRKRTGRSGAEVVLCEEIRPGETLVITHTGETYG